MRIDEGLLAGSLVGRGAAAAGGVAGELAEEDHLVAHGNVGILVLDPLLVAQVVHLIGLEVLGLVIGENAVVGGPEGGLAVVLLVAGIAGVGIHHLGAGVPAL